MFTWEQANQSRRASVLAATFTPAELARLYMLREQYQLHQNCGEFGLDERRLRFVRWLVAQGRLSEGCECGELLSCGGRRCRPVSPGAARYAAR